MLYREKRKKPWKRIALIAVIAFLAYIVLADFSPRVEHVEKIVPNNVSK